MPSINDDISPVEDLPIAQAIGAFTVGLGVLIGSSKALVWAAVNIAESYGVSELVIGLTIIALGTSLPELAASMVSAIKGHADIAIGAVVGSNMFNLLIVLAIPGLFSPLELSTTDLQRDLGTVFVTTAALAAFVGFGWRKEKSHARLGRMAGCLFLSSYVVYCLWLYYDISKV
jgi:cation:H+ antiporter